MGAQFKKRGFNYVDLETPPPALSRERWHEFVYDLYSARYGNIYTPRQLIQMLARANGSLQPVETAYVDENGRARDPFRPAIEPDGFADIDELEADRRYLLSQVASMLDQTDLFVFTLGLTEAWESIEDGVALPTCPGTVGGTFDTDKYRFKNFDYEETLQDMNAFIALAREKNPQMKFLLTVSPVPLTATATDQHVLPATLYSKSVLRAVAGALSQKHDFVDYFPSYELIASHPMRAMYYIPNLRKLQPRASRRPWMCSFPPLAISRAVTSKNPVRRHPSRPTMTTFSVKKPFCRLSANEPLYLRKLSYCCNQAGYESGLEKKTDVHVFALGSGAYETNPFSEIRDSRIFFTEPLYSERLETATSEVSIDDTHVWGLVTGTHNNRILRGEFWKEATPACLDHPDLRPVSRAVVDAIIDDDQRYIKAFLAQLKQIKAKFFVISCPPVRRNSVIAGSGIPLDIISAIDSRARQCFTNWLSEQGIPFIAPPEGTMDDQGFLLKEYSLEKTFTGKRDPHHANADYGTLMYKQIQDFLAQNHPEI
ncbi:GSCFA domain-containing protein [Ruegeria sp. 2205SS24-7]|nr:GSCFA domain-containing protein [Ruegeria sp. 2205SS24-7]